MGLAQVARRVEAPLVGGVARVHLVDDGEERAEAPLAAVGADGGEEEADPRVAHRRRRLRVAAGADDARRAQLAEARADEGGAARRRARERR